MEDTHIEDACKDQFAAFGSGVRSVTVVGDAADVFSYVNLSPPDECVMGV